MLLLSPDQVVSIDSLTEAVWQGCPPATSKTQIAICIASLRKNFKAAGCHDELITTTAPGYMLRSGRHRIDAREFKEHLARARQAAQRNDAAEAAELFKTALGMWRGPALDGIASHPVQARAAELEEQRLIGYEQHTALRLELGEHRTLIGELRTLVAQHPLREQARSHLMLAQYRSGRRAEAMETFRLGRRRSIDELGLEPGQALHDLHDAILRDDPALLAPPATARPAAASVVPAQLPADIVAFTGRRAELSALDTLLDEDAGAREGMPVGFLTGGAGVGKTALAIRWAHRSADRCADGQLYADMRGHERGGRSTGTCAVLDRFLRALGVPGDRVPESFDERVALYRTTLANRRVLIVLDNVQEFSQITPLLPGSGRSAVVVTGNDQLGELSETCAPVRLNLAPLSPDEATTLLVKIVGDTRVTDDPEATARLGQLCDRLPLTLRIVAAKLRAKPHWPVRHLVRRLEDPQQRLDELSHGDRDLRHRLRLSYQQLDETAARLYRSLGLLDLSEFTSAIAASVLKVCPVEAENVVERLVDAHLLHVARWHDTGNAVYRFQDLHRLYAQERACAKEGEHGKRLPEQRLCEDLSISADRLLSA